MLVGYMRVSSDSDRQSTDLQRDALLAAGLPVEWRAYSMGHNLCRPEIFDIAAWLKYHLALDPPTGQ